MALDGTASTTNAELLRLTQRREVQPTLADDSNSAAAESASQAGPDDLAEADPAVVEATKQQTGASALAQQNAAQLDTTQEPEGTDDAATVEPELVLADGNLDAGEADALKAKMANDEAFISELENTQHTVSSIDPEVAQDIAENFDSENLLAIGTQQAEALTDGPTAEAADAVDVSQLTDTEAQALAESKVEADLDKPFQMVLTGRQLKELYGNSTAQPAPVSNSVSASPEAAGTTASGNVVLSEIPAPVDGEIPAPVDGETPAPVDGETPAPVDGETPAPVDGETPAPVDGETPAPVDGETPVPEEPVELEPINLTDADITVVQDVFTYQRDENGDLILDEQGNPQIDPASHGVLVLGEMAAGLQDAPEGSLDKRVYVIQNLARPDQTASDPSIDGRRVEQAHNNIMLAKNTGLKIERVNKSYGREISFQTIANVLDNPDTDEAEFTASDVRENWSTFEPVLNDLFNEVGGEITNDMLNAQELAASGIDENVAAANTFDGFELKTVNNTTDMVGSTDNTFQPIGLNVVQNSITAGGVQGNSFAAPEETAMEDIIDGLGGDAGATLSYISTLDFNQQSNFYRNITQYDGEYLTSEDWTAEEVAMVTENTRLMVQSGFLGGVA